MRTTNKIRKKISCTKTSRLETKTFFAGRSVNVRGTAALPPWASTAFSGQKKWSAKTSLSSGTSTTSASTHETEAPPSLHRSLPRSLPPPSQSQLRWTPSSYPCPRCPKTNAPAPAPRRISWRPPGRSTPTTTTSNSAECRAVLLPVAARWPVPRKWSWASTGSPGGPCYAVCARRSRVWPTWLTRNASGTRRSRLCSSRCATWWCRWDFWSGWLWAMRVWLATDRLRCRTRWTRCCALWCFCCCTSSEWPAAFGEIFFLDWLTFSNHQTTCSKMKKYTQEMFSLHPAGLIQKSSTKNDRILAQSKYLEHSFDSPVERRGNFKAFIEISLTWLIDWFDWMFPRWGPTFNGKILLKGKIFPEHIRTRASGQVFHDFLLTFLRIKRRALRIFCVEINRVPNTTRNHLFRRLFLFRIFIQTKPFSEDAWMVESNQTLTFSLFTKPSMTSFFPSINCPISCALL